MDYNELQKIVRDLDSVEFDPETRDSDGSLGAILTEIVFHADRRFWQFTPTNFGAARFEDRLAAWVNNPELLDGDIATLLRLVPQIQFIDRDDLLTLYRAAFSGPIMRWLLDQVDLDFGVDEAEFAQRLAGALASTWFCPVTDSMNISDFHHINGIEGKDQRPSWRTVLTFGDVDVLKIKRYMAKKNLSRIVLLEDFVGTGTQCLPVLKFLVKKFCPEIPVLFVPLVISEIGEGNIYANIGEPAGFHFEGLFKIPLHVHVQEEPQVGETDLIKELRSLAIRSFENVRLSNSSDAEPIEHAFGFGKVGTLLVMYTNCPNNTLPLIWHQSPRWAALFPRVSRY
jgi:hypothetical protein